MRRLVHKLEPVENGVDCRRALHQAYHAVRGNIIQEHRRNPGMRHCVTPLEVAERIAGIFIGRIMKRDAYSLEWLSVCDMPLHEALALGGIQQWRITETDGGARLRLDNLEWTVRRGRFRCDVLFGSPCGIYGGTNPPMDAGFLELLDRWMPEIHAQACELASEVGALLLAEDIRTITERNGGEDR